MKYYAVQTESESLTTTKVFENENEARSYARMLWNHLTDSEKKKKAVNVYLVDTGSDDLENGVESRVAEIINDGLYDEEVE